MIYTTIKATRERRAVMKAHRILYALDDKMLFVFATAAEYQKARRLMVEKGVFS